MVRRCTCHDKAVDGVVLLSELRHVAFDLLHGAGGGNEALSVARVARRLASGGIEVEFQVSLCL